MNQERDNALASVVVIVVVTAHVITEIIYLAKTLSYFQASTAIR